jgi:oxygen-independent coproporphyrinogen-3 oxidase
MSGIYLHIPFCKKACHYCNFHFSTSLRLKDDLVSALCREIELRREYLGSKVLSSIYFGGGTPSILEKMDLKRIFDTLSENYYWNDHTEITLEANPDDLTLTKIKDLKQLGVNRLSIGIQSFFDSDLQWMNRAHTSDEAINSIRHAQDVGITNLTVDLIYGSPYTTHDMWHANIDKVLSMGIQHVSAYCLTVEEKTALHHMIKKGSFQTPDQDHANEQYAYLIDTLTKNGFEHYEISNFAKPAYRAIHNTSYWQGAKYIGIGPSAHSFDGRTRSWNLANNKKYIDTIAAGKLPMETELLTPAMLYNEYVMTGLRTSWGIDLPHIQAIHLDFGLYFEKNITKHLERRLVTAHEGQYILTHEGKFFADQIAMDLFWVED